MAIVRDGSSLGLPPKPPTPVRTAPSVSPPRTPVRSPEPEAAIGEQVSEFYKELSVAAVDLNAASDELGKCVAALDTALKVLNLGVSTWIRVAEHEDQNQNFWIHKLGYAKIAGTWGIALRTVEGNERWPEESEREEWLFNNAPRALRIEAVDKIPELLQGLIKEANSTSQKIREKTEQARHLATAITHAAAELAPKRK